MSSKDKILGIVKKNQPPLRQLPVLPGAPQTGTPGAGEAQTGVPQTDEAPADEAHLNAFVQMLEAIGGTAYLVSGWDRIASIIRERYSGARRIVSGCAELATLEMARAEGDPHALENVDLAILPVHFGVAENGACWITEAQMVQRALPFIAQHLALVLRRENILPDMHAAYARIASLDAEEPYGFAAFIAGPSKTADIEQSLVLGAHGPASLTVFLLDEQQSDAGYY